MEMSVCPCCERHVNVSDARCPFCKCDKPRRRGTSILTAIALSTGLAATQGCYGGAPHLREGDDARPRQPIQSESAPSSSETKPGKPH